MNFLRQHWYDLGLFLAAATGAALLFYRPTGLALILWINLIALFLHQAEEYRFPGTFPGMMNRVMFASPQPDRYPLNPNTALIVNTLVGWGSYALAAVFAGKAVWLGIAAILVSAGNFIAHTFLFNLRGKTKYSPGMLTAILLFLPISVWFFLFIIQQRLAGTGDWIAGLLLGVILNYVGILKLIDWLKDRDTSYVFPQRNVRSPRHH
jgi:hypothetical protein